MIMQEHIPTYAPQNDPTAAFRIGYGLYVATSFDGERDNGLIVNAVMQVTSTPSRIAVAINKQNYSHDVIRTSGIMNINCLTVNTPFSLFQRFGFASGRDTDKFYRTEPPHSANGLIYLPRYSNAFFSLKVEQYLDLGTHGLFICAVTESQVLSNDESMTYAYYHANVKPKPEKKPEKTGYVCKICGYVHEGDTLPADFVCPICKHGAVDFEKL